MVKQGLKQARGPGLILIKLSHLSPNNARLVTCVILVAINTRARGRHDSPSISVRHGVRTSNFPSSAKSAGFSRESEGKKKTGCELAQSVDAKAHSVL